VIDEAEATVVREAARRLLAGESGGSIVRDFARRGLQTTQGGTWSAWNLRDLLTRETPEGSSGALLAESDRERIREMYDSRKTGKRREGRRLLTGLVRCGACSEKMIHRPHNGRRFYVCVDVLGKVETRIKAADLESHVVAEAGRRWIAPTTLVDTTSPAYEERERLVAEQDELAAADLPLRMIKKRGVALQVKINAIDAELGRVKIEPDPEATSAQWAGLAEFPFGDLSQDQDARRWLQTLVDSITVEPVDGGRSAFSAERVAITWRWGVEVAS
jgi:site-specific DNA recombinase